MMLQEVSCSSLDDVPSPSKVVVTVHPKLSSALTSCAHENPNQVSVLSAQDGCIREGDVVSDHLRKMKVWRQVVMSLRTFSLEKSEWENKALPGQGVGALANERMY